MPIYISHVTLTEKGVRELKDAPNRLEENRRLWEECGGKLLSWYVVMGDFDYCMISEAPNEKVMTEIAIKASSRGRARYKTYPAIPVEEFSEITERLSPPPVIGELEMG